MRSDGRADGLLRPLVDVLAPGGWIYRDAHYLVADVELDLARARRFVPRPLRLARPGRASVFTARFPYTTFGSVYREAGIFFHVERLGGTALFCPWILVDDDVALIAGRELLGYPKKLGELDFRIEGDRITGVARRRGAELVRMEGTLGAAVPDPPPMLGRPHRNVRTSLGLALPKIIAFTPHEEHIEARRVEVELQIGGSDRDPLSSMGLGAVHASYLHRVNLGGRGLPVPYGLVSPLGFVRQLLFRMR